LNNFYLTPALYLKKERDWPPSSPYQEPVPHLMREEDCLPATLSLARRAGCEVADRALLSLPRACPALDAGRGLG